MSKPAGAALVLRMFSSAVINQALLSAASLLVGLILIRRTADQQYGYYILAVNALLLMTSLQSAFFAPSLVNRITHLDRRGRSDTVGGLYRAQRHMLGLAAAAAAALAAVLWGAGMLAAGPAILAIGVVGASLATLNREYFRMTLLAYRRPEDVLRCDAAYVALLVAGALLATLAPFPALWAVIGLAGAALVGALLLSRALQRHEAWNPAGAPGILREIAPFGFWSTAGAAVHWTFSQGYSFLVAATLDVSAVAAVAATRLLMMPVNLLSSGLSTLMLPMASGWLAAHGAPTVLRRLLLFAGGVAGAALCYFALLWLCRDWIFAHLLKKTFANRDMLLQLWCGAFLLMIMRDQLLYLLVVRSRFRTLTAITSASAVVSLLVSFWAMRRFGEIGAPLGVLVGEFLSALGIVVESLREARQRGAAATAPQPGPGNALAPAAQG
ncbi:MAG: capsular biosynthesis protein [Nevskia sp.]|nr:capsular biosynthesis protein [Nevskia sp.]